MLAKAEQRLRPTKDSSVPYHYVAQLHYSLGDFSADGSYEILWAAPTRFRQELRLGKMSESEVVLGDKLYVRRNTPSAAYFVERLWSLVGLPTRRGAVPTGVRPEKIRKVYAGKYGSEDVTCMESTGLAKGRTFCIDSAKGFLVSETYRSTRSDLKLSSTFDNFFDFGNRAFPGHVLSKVGSERLEVRVQRMNPVLNFADATFSVPDRSARFTWCAPMKEKRSRNTVDPTHLSQLLIPPGASGFHAFYFEVAPDGRAERIIELHPDGSAQRLAVKGLNTHQFPTRTCNERPVEYETVRFIWSTMSLNPLTGRGVPPTWGVWTDPPMF